MYLCVNCPSSSPSDVWIPLALQHSHDRDVINTSTWLLRVLQERTCSIHAWMQSVLKPVEISTICRGENSESHSCYFLLPDFPILYNSRRELLQPARACAECVWDDGVSDSGTPPSMKNTFLGRLIFSELETRHIHTTMKTRQRPVYYLQYLKQKFPITLQLAASMVLILCIHIWCQAITHVALFSC